MSSVPQEADSVDMLIAGAGSAGLALAVAIKQTLGAAFSVAVVDPALARRVDDPRASAVAAAARRMLEALHVWRDVASEAQPIRDMVVTDSRLSDAVRQRFLAFEGDVAPGEPFAHMIENGPLLRALLAKARMAGVLLRADRVTDFAATSEQAVIRLGDGSDIRARLVVAADGARSFLRERAGIGTIGWAYEQAAIATTVAHARDHDGRAVEHFLPAGPFAILPLTGRRCSIVWTETAREAARMTGLPDAEFLAELQRRFGFQLGELTLAGPRRAFPLSLFVARSFVATRLALLGEAAHVIHPIAGQGLNIGMRDVAALAEAIADAARLGLDHGGGDVLARYERWRRFDTQSMAVATDVLNRLFSNESGLLRLTRDVGLGLVDRLPGLKDLFIRDAAGLTGALPRLLQGQEL